MTGARDGSAAPRSMDGRICIVTGASSGIGRATAERLAEMGATVVMACRDRERGEIALDKVSKRSRGGSAELMLADLASLQSTRDFVREYEGKHNSLHVLINNAGVMCGRRSVTSDGFETTFQVNYLSHFLLTNLLLGVLKKGAPSRIINVSSASHIHGRIDLDDLQAEEAYGVMEAYAQSKLAQVLFTYELSRRLEGTAVTANCLHPGVTATSIWRNHPGPTSLLEAVSRQFLFLKRPEKGAVAPVYLASSSAIEGVSGRYFDQLKETRSSADSYDESLAKTLWEKSASLVGHGPVNRLPEPGLGSSR